MVFWAENPKSRDHRLPVTAISQQVQTWHITHTTSMLSTAYTGTQPALLAHQHHPTDSSIQIPKFRHDVTEFPYWQLVQTLHATSNPQHNIQRYQLSCMHPTCRRCGKCSSRQQLEVHMLITVNVPCAAVLLGCS